MDILYRGQTRRKGEKVNMAGEPIPSNWAYGGIFAPNQDGDFAVIYGVLNWNKINGIIFTTIEKFPVYRDTVGRYLEISDRNEVNLFSGDIVNIYRKDKLNPNGEFALFLESCELQTSPIKGIMLYELNGKMQDGTPKPAYLKFHGFYRYFNDDEFDYQMEMIGNIFDNKELLEVQNEQRRTD